METNGCYWESSECTSCTNNEEFICKRSWPCGFYKGCYACKQMSTSGDCDNLGECKWSGGTCIHLQDYCSGLSGATCVSDAKCGEVSGSCVPCQFETETSCSTVNGCGWLNGTCQACDG